MSETRSILVIDDEESICRAFERFFGARGWRVRSVATGAAGLAAYADRRADVVFLDVRLPDRNGLEVLDELNRLDERACVVVITAYGDLETVVQAVKGKAFDYVPKPLDLDRVLELAQRAARSRAATQAAPAGREGPQPAIVGASPAMQEVYKKIATFAAADAPVLILGETGTGKDLIARLIHDHSERKARPFVAVNCGALPEGLVEGELFGHVRGAFTGADADRPGRFEAADGGTLFLDEVGELSPAVQVKLLRVLDTQVVERVGSARPIRLSVRVLAATNRDLAADVRGGRFRADLYYRLAVLQLELPPLTRRREDILPLAEHFLAARRRAGQPAPALSRAAAELLVRHAWPGNVRELRNAVEHAAAAACGHQILPTDLPESLRQPAAAEGAGQAADRAAGDYVAALPPAKAELYRLAVEPVEKAVIERALARCGGNQSAAAAMLGLHRNTLRKKIAELGIGRAGQTGAAAEGRVGPPDAENP